MPESARERNPLRTRSFGTFRRAVPLPTDVDEDEVEAHFKNNVPSVRLPNPPAATARPRRIEVKAA